MANAIMEHEGKIKGVAQSTIMDRMNNSILLYTLDNYL